LENEADKYSLHNLKHGVNQTIVTYKDRLNSAGPLAGYEDKTLATKSIFNACQGIKAGNHLEDGLPGRAVAPFRYSLTQQRGGMPQRYVSNYYPFWAPPPLL
jgi:hypothetical protein